MPARRGLAQAAPILARLPIREKLVFAYTGVIALVLAVIGLFLYVHFKSGLDEGLNQTLTARANEGAALVRQDGVAALRRERPLLASGDLTVQVVSKSGVLRFSTSRAGEPLLTRGDLRRTAGRTSEVDRHERERVLVRRLPKGGGLVLVAASLQQRERALELLNGALLVGGGLTLFVTALAGSGLAAAVLRPMDGMRRAAASISDVDPQARLPLPPTEDEVHRLGTTLNDMLARLEQARDRERAFVSDASHELRTPLAVLKTEVEVALRKDNPPEALRAALQVATEEIDRLTQLTEDLLLVARSESGRMELDCRPVNAGRLLEDMDRRFRVRARESGRVLTVDGEEDATVSVDVARIEQALTNLVDNALRHGAGEVRLRSRVENGHVELHVLDEGPGLPPAFIPHAFERFSRAQPGRTGQGTGLGLAIVQLIADAHGGQASVHNLPEGGGTDASLRLPTGPRPTRAPMRAPGKPESQS